MSAVFNKKAAKAQEKNKSLRDSFWPNVDEGLLWDRKLVKGFTVIPRTMPVLMNIIDALTKNKPGGRSYFVLWCRAFDHSMLVIDNPMTFASEAGFTGERALSTWKDRMASLKELGFIDAKQGPAGPYHYVLIFNPHKVIWNLRDKIQDGLFQQLQVRAIDIGAKDMEPAAPKDAAKGEDQGSEAK